MRINLSDVELTTGNTSSNNTESLPKWWENSQLLFSTTMEFYQWQNRLKGKEASTVASSFVQVIHEASSSQPGLWSSTRAKLRSCVTRALGVDNLDQAALDDIAQYTLRMIRSNSSLHLHLVTFAYPARSVPLKWRISVWSVLLRASSSSPKIYQEALAYFRLRMSGGGQLMQGGGLSKDLQLIIQQKAQALLSMDPATLSSIQQNSLSLALVIYIVSFVYKQHHLLPIDLADSKIYLFLAPFLRALLVDEGWNPGPFKDPKCGPEFARTAAQITEMFFALVAKMPSEFRSGSGPFAGVRREILAVFEASDPGLFRLVTSASKESLTDLVMPLVKNLFIGHLPLPVVLVCWDQLICGTVSFYDEQMIPTGLIVDESSFLYHVRSFEEKVAHLCVAVLLVLGGQVCKMSALFDEGFKDACAKISLFQFKEALGKLKLSQYSVDARTGRHSHKTSSRVEKRLVKFRKTARFVGLWSLFLQHRFKSYRELVRAQRQAQDDQNRRVLEGSNAGKKKSISAVGAGAGSQRNSLDPPFMETLVAIQGKISLLFNKASSQSRDEAVTMAMLPPPETDEKVEFED